MNVYIMRNGKKNKVLLSSIFKKEDKNDYLPPYVFVSDEIEINWFYYRYYILLLAVFKILLKWRLKILGSFYKKYDNDPKHKEVENIYTREAKNYEYKHHLTTNFRDTWWRRQIGLEIIMFT